MSAAVPRRVLHVIDSLLQGGAEQLLVTAAESGDGRYALQVVALHGVDPDSQVVRALRALGVPLHAVPQRRWHDPRHVADVARIVRRERIDLVHAHLPYAITVAAAAARFAGRPVVATLHGANDVDHAGGRVTAAVQRLALRRGVAVAVACAPEIAEAARTRVGVAPGRLVVQRNAVRVDAAGADPADVATVRRRLLAGAGGPLVVAVGNVLPAKGHEVLVDAAALLADALPGLRVAIVGRLGHNADVVEARIAARGQGERVALTGASRDVARILAAADVFALPSHSEGLPLALLEALASGTPVVATAVGGVPRVVRDGVHGRIVPPGDPAGLAAAIARAVAEPEASAAMAAAARAHVRRSYGALAFAGRTAAIYDAVLGRPAPRPAATEAGRGVLTVAHGSRRYVGMAKALARSLERHAPGLPRAVVTDSADPELSALFDVVVPFRSELGRGFEQKLHLDAYSPFARTLYVDADSLVVADPREAWPLLEAAPVGIPGRSMVDGHWYGDIAAIRAAHGLARFPRLNGGLIAFDDGPRARAVFATARDAMARYDELGFERMRSGGRNDEVVFALALALHGLGAIDERGLTSRTPIGISGPLHLDVLRGGSRFVKEGAVVEPAIVHFSGWRTRGFHYGRERAKLALAGRLPLPDAAVARLVDAVANPPYTALAALARPALRVVEARHRRRMAGAP